MSDTLKKVIDLIKKTGDRCIVVDYARDSEYVVMTLEEYESLSGRHEQITRLSEKDFLERINREIAVWKSAQEDENFPNWEFLPSKKEGDVPVEKKDSQEEVFYFEPID